MKLYVPLLSLLLAVATIPVTAGAAPPKAKTCDQSAAQTLIGNKNPSDARAKRLTGATTVRQVRPGDMMTMDFRADRVTIETDPATGRVVRAKCG